MLKELAVEQFSFRCGHCEYRWISDYDVQHVEDGHGHVCEYYSLNGLPVIAPTTEGGVSCPHCGALRVLIRLQARRTIPVATHAGGHPGQPLDQEKHAEAKQAPLLRGEKTEAENSTTLP